MSDAAKEAAERIAACPFCGSHETVNKSYDFEILSIACSNCGAEGPGGKDETESISLWNSRAYAPKLEEIGSELGMAHGFCSSGEPDSALWHLNKALAAIDELIGGA